MRTGITSDLTAGFGSEATSKNQIFLKDFINKQLSTLDTSCEELVVLLDYLGHDNKWNVTSIIFKPDNLMDIFYYNNKESEVLTAANNLQVNPKDFKIYKREIQVDDGEPGFLNI